MSDATPRPWRVGKDESGHPDVWIVGPDDRLVLSALVGPRTHTEQKANAKHATEALNAHDRLQTMADVGKELVKAGRVVIRADHEKGGPSAEEFDQFVVAITAYEKASGEGGGD